jgi:DNA polymerase alpha-associated DNA helicase A
MTPRTVDIPSFTAAQLSLLDAELAAETASTATLLTSSSPTTLSRAGLAVLNLVVSSQRTGLGGKTVLELVLDPAIGNGGYIGDTGIRVGDVVRVGEQPKGNEKRKEKAGLEAGGVEGVVVRVSTEKLQVALGKDNDNLEGLGSRIWV